MRLRFVYKIFSPYDGFKPSRIPERMLPGDTLELGWKRYIDDVERGSEVWIYFHDGAKEGIEPGVYIKARVASVDYNNRRVRVKVDEYDTVEPITEREDTSRIAELVALRGQQVFPLPIDWAPLPRGFACTLDTDGSRCRSRLCGSCPTWRGLRRIDPTELQRPPKLGNRVHRFAAAHWVIPARSFIYQEGRPASEIERASAMFYDFKHGAAEKAFPLALSMNDAFARSGFEQPAAIVPIPLSPEKAARGEIHRARLLAKELVLLLDAPVREWLKLTGPISKRKSRSDGLTDAQHWRRYRELLTVSPAEKRANAVLLVDDVSTKGGTLSAAAHALTRENSSLHVDAITAGQMVIRAAVADHRRMLS